MALALTGTDPVGEPGQGVAPVEVDGPGPERL